LKVEELQVRVIYPERIDEIDPGFIPGEKVDGS
jgi:hypothetical protein